MKIYYDQGFVCVRFIGTHAEKITLTRTKAMSFGMSVVDNGGGLPHTVAPEVLTLE